VRMCDTPDVQCISDIGVSTGAYLNLSLASALLRISELTAFAEVLSLGPHSILDKANARVLEVAGLPFSVHGPFAHFELGSRWASRHKAAMEMHRRHIDAAAELGAGLYVVHPDVQRKPRPRSVRVIATMERACQEFAALQKQYDMPIAMENLPFARHSHFVAPDDLDVQGMAIVLDAGHAAITETLDTWLARTDLDIRHVHLHDNQGSHGGDLHDPCGTGVVDAAQVIAAARGIGATIILEHKNEAEVQQSFDYLKTRGLLTQCLD
jgi:sugar phosphate isomerase/epimerase